MGKIQLKDPKSWENKRPTSGFHPVVLGHQCQAGAGGGPPAGALGAVGWLLADQPSGSRLQPLLHLQSVPCHSEKAPGLGAPPVLVRKGEWVEAASSENSKGQTTENGVGHSP